MIILFNFFPDALLKGVKNKFINLSVSPKARGMGLANDLVQRSVDLAKCLGYKMCKSEATGRTVINGLH